MSYQAQNGSGTLNSDAASTLYIAAHKTVSLLPFDRLLDEITISNAARSADWIKLCYETQKATVTAVVHSDWSVSLDTLGGGAIRDSSIYVGTKDDFLYKVNLSTGAKTWTYDASTYGNVGMPTYKYNTTTSKYQVFASAGTYIIGRSDNGSSSSQIFSPISLSGTLGNPYASPDDTYLYATHTTGNAASGWPKTVGSANYKHGPWIDITNNRVVFGAEDGAIVSYELE